MTKINTKKIIIIALSVAVAAVAFLRLYSAIGPKMRITYPLSLDVSQKTWFRCEVLMDAGIFADSVRENIEGNLSKSTESIAIEIKDDGTLIFTTSTSVKVGYAEGATFHILRDDADALIATSYDPQGLSESISAIAMNKKTGLTSWVKARPAFLTDPSGTIVYMLCQ